MELFWALGRFLEKGCDLNWCNGWPGCRGKGCVLYRVGDLRRMGRRRQRASQLLQGLTGLTVDGIQLQGAGEVLAGLFAATNLNADRTEGVESLNIKGVVLEDIQIGVDGVVS